MSTTAADATDRAPAAVLYITYDGVLEPLGESQVLSYIERLAVDFTIALLSYEKAADLADRPRVVAMEQRLASHGIRWLRLRYSKWPPALSTAWDVWRGIISARRYGSAMGVRVIHARSYVSSLVALGARSASGAKYLFDMRGFWVDEKIEAGHWRRNGMLARCGQWWERRFLRSADAIVSLTRAAVPLLAERGFQRGADVPVEVIPTCVDLERFVPRAKDPRLIDQLGLANARVLGSVGTLTNWYLRHDTLRYLGQLVHRLPDSRVLFVTRDDHQALIRDAIAAGIPEGRIVCTTAAFSDMPRFVSLFDLGVFFIRPAISKRGSAATKLAEFLACGVPVVINDGVGDSGQIVRERRVGVVLPALVDEAVDASLSQVEGVLADPSIARSCRDAAEQLFDVWQGVGQYRALYQRLAARS